MACRSRVLLECLLLSVVANITCGVRDSDEFVELLDVGHGGVRASNGQREDRVVESVSKSRADDGKLIAKFNTTDLNSSAMVELIAKSNTTDLNSSAMVELIAKSNTTDLNSSAMVVPRFDTLHLSASMILLADGTGMVDVFALLEGAMSAVGLGADAADLGQGGGMLLLGGHAKKVKGWEKAHGLGGAANFIGWAGLAISGYDTYTAARDLVQAWRGNQANGCELTVHGVHLTVAGGGFAAGLLGQFCLSDHSGTIAGAAAAASGLLWSAVEDKLMSWCRDGQPAGAGQNMQLPVDPSTGSQMTLQQATALAAGTAFAPVPPNMAGGSRVGSGFRGMMGFGAQLNPVQTAFGFGQSPVRAVTPLPLGGLRYAGAAGAHPFAPGVATHPVGCPVWRTCQVQTLQCTHAGCQWVVKAHPC